VLDLVLVGRVRLLALAQALREALREDAQQRVGEVERVQAHVEQADDRFRRGVRVQGGEHQWPVSEASMPMPVVSLSRISPTMMMSGSARRKDFIATAKVNPAFGLTWHWRRPFCVISTGSSAVQILLSGVFRWPSTECSVVVLPEPVGPHTKKRP
jgi:hypothetical protein